TEIDKWDPVLKTAPWLLKETKWDNIKMRKKAVRWLFEKVAKDFIKLSQSLKEKRISLEEAERYLIENDLRCFGYRSFVNFGLFGLKNYYQERDELDYLKILKEAEIDKDYPLLERVFWLVIKDISWDREKEEKALEWLLRKTLPEEFLDLIGKKTPLKRLVDMMIEKNIFYPGRDEFYKMHLGGIIARFKGMIFEIYKSHNYAKKNPVFRKAPWFCLKKISSNYWRNIHNQYKAWLFIANILGYKSLSDLKKAQEKGEVTSRILRRYRLEASWIEKGEMKEEVRKPKYKKAVEDFIGDSSVFDIVRFRRQYLEEYRTLLDIKKKRGVSWEEIISKIMGREIKVIEEKRAQERRMFRSSKKVFLEEANREEMVRREFKKAENWAKEGKLKRALRKLKRLRKYSDSSEIEELIQKIEEKIKAEDPLEKFLKENEHLKLKREDILRVFSLFKIKMTPSRLRKLIKIIAENGITFADLEEKRKKLEKAGVVIGSPYLSVSWLKFSADEIAKRYFRRLRNEARKLKREYEEIGEIVDFPEIIREIEPDIKGEVLEKVVKDIESERRGRKRILKDGGEESKILHFPFSLAKILKFHTLEIWIEQYQLNKLYKKGEFEECLILAEDLIKKLSHHEEKLYKVKGILARCCEKIGESFYKRGEFEKAAQFTEKSAFVYREIGEKRKAIRQFHRAIHITYKAGERFIEEGKIKEAEEFCIRGIKIGKKLLEMGRKLESWRDSAIACSLIADGYLRLQDFRKNAIYRQKAARYDRRAGNRKEEARNLFVSAKSWLIVGNLNKAQKNAEQAYKIYKELDEQEKMVKALEILSYCFHFKGSGEFVSSFHKENINKALEYYREVLDFYIKKGMFGFATTLLRCITSSKELENINIIWKRKRGDISKEEFDRWLARRLRKEDFDIERIIREIKKGTLRGVKICKRKDNREENGTKFSWRKDMKFDGGKIKAIFTDYDDTLEKAFIPLGKKKIELISELVRKDIFFVIVSGQSLKSLEELVGKRLPQDIRKKKKVFFLSEMGSVWGYFDEEGNLGVDIKHSKFSSYEEKEKIIKEIGKSLEEIKRRDWNLLIKENEILVKRGENLIIKAYPKISMVTVKFFEEKHLMKEMAKLIKKRLRNIDSLRKFKITYSSVAIDISLVSKKEAVKDFLDFYKIPEDEIAVFGDSKNDISMLKVGKYSFFCGEKRLLPVSLQNRVRIIEREKIDEILRGFLNNFERRDGGRNLQEFIKIPDEDFYIEIKIGREYGGGEIFTLKKERVPFYMYQALRKIKEDEFFPQLCVFIGREAWPLIIVYEILSKFLNMPQAQILAPEIHFINEDKKNLEEIRKAIASLRNPLDNPLRILIIDATSQTGKTLKKAKEYFSFFFPEAWIETLSLILNLSTLEEEISSYIGGVVEEEGLYHKYIYCEWKGEIFCADDLKKWFSILRDLTFEFLEIEREKYSAFDNLDSFVKIVFPQEKQEVDGGRDYTKKRIDFITRSYDWRAPDAEKYLTSEVIDAWIKGLIKFQKEFCKKDKLLCVVGKDTRLSSERIAKRIIENLLNLGIDVIDIGLVTTPILYFATLYFDSDLGIMVTASHNPPQENGFKVVIKDKLGQRNPTTEEIKKISEYAKKSLDNTQEFIGFKRKADLIRENSEKILKKYVNMVIASCWAKGASEWLSLQRKYSYKELVDSLPLEGLKVVIDPANGTAGEALKEVLERLGAEVVGINMKPDGRFPAHLPDPTVRRNMDQA
ncbi:MAG: hypothetical protein B6D56_08325, partial [Candidatus Omnitrophica bacterium 4484_70.1]